MNLLNKLTIKNLKLNKKRTAVTIIGIMLSVALITAVASMYASGIESLINYEIKLQGNYHIVYYDVPINDIDTFKNNRGINKISVTHDVGYAKVDSQNENKPYIFIKEYSKTSLENLSVNLVEGRLPENDTEVVIPTHLRTNGRVVYNVGDTIELEVGKRIDSEGKILTQNDSFIIDNESETTEESIGETETKTYEIVGIAERPSRRVEPYTAPGYTFITYKDESKMSGNVDVFVKYTKEATKNIYENTAKILGVNSELFIKMTNTDKVLSETELQGIQAEMSKARYNIDINQYLIDLETNPLTSSSVGGLGTVVAIVIGIIIFTSVFCIKNSFDISITEKTKQYGMLRSVGATKKQIKRNVFYEATVLGIIGIPLGILLGFLATFILVLISNYFIGDGFALGFKLEFAFSYIAVVVAIILGIVTIYLSAFRSARRASKVSPIESVRNSSNIKIKAKKLKSPKIIKKIFGIGGEISYKNLKRNRKKYRTTVISIVVSVFVFIAMSSFISMAFDAVERDIQLIDYTISLGSGNYNKEIYDKYLGTTKLDNIQDYSVVRRSGLEFERNYYSKEYIDWTFSEDDLEQKGYAEVISLGKEQYKKYINSLGLNYDGIKDKAILMDFNNIQSYDKETNKPVSKYMRICNFNKGDKISGTLEGKLPFEISIGAITKERPLGLKNRDGAVLILSDELYEQKVQSTESLQIFFKSDNSNKLQDDIEEYLKGENYFLNNAEENAKSMRNVFTLIGIFLYGFIIVISLIGITNIFNTITTNMELRRQEFAMLKSVGMTTHEFKRMIRLESLFMGIKALLFGVPIGIGFSYLIYDFLTKSSGMPYYLPILAIVIAVCAVFILISLIMKYSMKKINKQNTIETIRNENI